MDPILDVLNDKQREAVLHIDGPLLVLAGAGSGKTRVITHRFAYIIREKKISVNNILAVTFTNKAAGEMKDRISKLVGIDTTFSWVRTFHSAGLQILHKYSERIGYPKDFIIYDDDDMKSAIKSIMKSLNLDLKTYDYNSIAWNISYSKDRLISPEEYERNINSNFESIVSIVYKEYENFKFKNKTMDFGDLINKTIELFLTNKDVLEFFQNLWHYVMVDEFQDTNIAQYKLINLICEKRKNICVVGDDDQSIYGWRGANVDNIFDFQRKYNAKIIPLEQNYRSTNIILNVANSVVSYITKRMPKELWTERKSNEKVRIIEFRNERDEAFEVIRLIKEIAKKEDRNYGEFAIFYRTNAQSRSFEEALLFHNIPYKIFGGQKFYERKEIKDVIAYIKLVIDPYDTISFERIVNVPPRKIGDVSTEKLKNIAKYNNYNYIQLLLEAESFQEINKSAIESLKNLGELLYELNQNVLNITPTNFVKIIIDTVNYKEYIINYDQSGKDRWDNVEELINSIKRFEEENPNSNIIDYINEISLNFEIDNFDSDDKRNYVSLMTIHNSKGLEFPVVFITGVNEGLIPHRNSSSTDSELNEERRLFYVAITRAKDKLFMTYSLSRLSYGESYFSEPSSFLNYIPLDLVDYNKLNKMNKVNDYFEDDFEFNINITNYKRYKKKSLSENTNIINENYKINQELKVGDRVRHKMFGEGVVYKISNNFVTVKFKDYGLQNFGIDFLYNLILEK